MANPAQRDMTREAIGILEASVKGDRDLVAAAVNSIIEEGAAPYLIGALAAITVYALGLPGGLTPAQYVEILRASIDIDEATDDVSGSR